jgi:hypothetical protein
MKGRIVRASHLARQAVAVFTEMGLVPIVRAASVPLVQALALDGRVDEAKAVLADVDALGLPATYVLGAELLQARAWAEVAGGHLAGAAERLWDAADLARDRGEYVFEAAALHDLARLGHAKDVIERLAELTGVVEGDLVQARAAHSRAVAVLDGLALEEVSDKFESMGADLLAAEAAADAAVSHRKAGETRRAAAVDRRAQILGARCQGARTPALSAVSVRAALTVRELKITRLAAVGCPTRRSQPACTCHCTRYKTSCTPPTRSLDEGRAELVEVLRRS